MASLTQRRVHRSQCPARLPLTMFSIAAAYQFINISIYIYLRVFFSIHTFLHFNKKKYYLEKFHKITFFKTDNKNNALFYRVTFFKTLRRLKKSLILWKTIFRLDNSQILNKKKNTHRYLFLACKSGPKKEACYRQVEGISQRCTGGITSDKR